MVSMIEVLIVAVVKINVDKQEVGYDDRSSSVIPAKEKRMGFTEKIDV